MNKIETVFGRPRVFLPVIHAISRKQVLEQFAIARDASADGVFIINQGGMSAQEVVHLAGGLADSFQFVGVNLLGYDLPSAFDAVVNRPGIRGLWCDDAEAQRWFTLRNDTRWTDPEVRHIPDQTRLYFGGVAFKHQAPVPAVRWGTVAREAVQLGVDVVTTSGDRTGMPPSPAKLRAMREAIGDHPLAVASGISPENVHMFLPYADAYLVASGIEESFGYLDPAKARQLADLIHGWQPEGGNATG